MCGNYHLSCDSLVLCEQIKTIDKKRLHNKMATINELDQQRIDRAVKLSLGLTN